MPAQTEYRILKATSLRAGRAGNSNDAPPFIEGYAATFNRLSSDLGGFREKIKPGTFARALREKQDVRCFFNHQVDLILGRSSAGTLSVKETDKGLWYHRDLPPTQLARDLHASISRGDVNECSFSFMVPAGGQTWSENSFSKDPNDENYDPDFDPDEDEANFACRTLTDVDLRDVAPVVWPAYPGTQVAARAEKRSHSNTRIYSEATTMNLSQEQRIHLSGTCGNRFAEVPEGTPEKYRTIIVEHRARILGIKPQGSAPAIVNDELASKIRALNSL